MAILRQRGRAYSVRWTDPDGVRHEQKVGTDKRVAEQAADEDDGLHLGSVATADRRGPRLGRRRHRANVGAFHVCLWTFTMTEAWAWNRPADELVDRSDSPWDSPLRRPSHADKRRAWRCALLGEEIRAVLRPGVTEGEIPSSIA
jgi:hypothetical protein